MLGILDRCAQHPEGRIGKNKHTNGPLWIKISILLFLFLIFNHSVVIPIFRA